MNRLNQIEARMNAATEGPWDLIGGGEYVTPVGIMVAPDDGGVNGADAEFIAHARADVPDMTAALRAVLEIHQDGGESQGYFDDGSYGDMPHCCTECGAFGEYGVPFPCLTVAAIRHYLGDDK